MLNAKYRINHEAWARRVHALESDTDEHAALKRIFGFKYCEPYEEWVISSFAYSSWFSAESEKRKLQSYASSGNPVLARHLALLDDMITGRMPQEYAVAMSRLYRVLRAEISLLTKPGPLFSHRSEFQRTTLPISMWLYALRAHLRPTPRTHFHDITIQRQDEMLRNAMELCPNIVGAATEEIR